MDASSHFTAVGWAAAIGTIFTWFATGAGLFAFTSSWLLRKRVFRVERTAHRSDAANYTSFILLPLASVLSAIIAGIGINLVTTDTGQGNDLIGWLMILVAIFMVVYAGYAGLNPQYSYRFGVVRLRRRIADLERAIDGASSLSLPARTAMSARLRRMVKAGQRIAERGQRCSVREQFRHRWTCAFLVLVIVSNVTVLVLRCLGSVWPLLPDPALTYGCSSGHPYPYCLRSAHCWSGRTNAGGSTRSDRSSSTMPPSSCTRLHAFHDTLCGQSCKGQSHSSWTALSVRVSRASHGAPALPRVAAGDVSHRSVPRSRARSDRSGTDRACG